MTVDLMDIDLVTEFLIDVPDEFSGENIHHQKLLEICKNAKKYIEHYFVIFNKDYDII